MRRHATALPIVLPLIFSLTLTPPTTHAATASDARAKALATSTSIEHTILNAIDATATGISAADQQKFTTALLAAMREQLRLLEARYRIANNRLEETVGFGTSLNALWTSITSNQEDVAKLFQEKINDAMAYAKIAPQRAEMDKNIETRMAEIATGIYQEYRQKFNQIITREVSAASRLGPLKQPVIAQLIDRIDVTSRDLAMQEGQIDPSQAVATPWLTLGVVGTALSARVGQALARQFGLGSAEVFIGRRIGTILLGPIGAVIMVGSMVVDAFKAKNTAVKAAQDALWQSYHGIAGALTDPQTIGKITQAVVAGLEQQLETDRRAVAVQLERFYRGREAQAHSPDYTTFKNRTDAGKEFDLVAEVFGDDLIDMPMTLKFQLAHDLGPQQAREMVQRHGKGFVTLYGSQSGALAQIMRGPRYQEIVHSVLAATDSAADLLFYKRSLDRFGGLDEPQTDALLLIHRLHPGKRPEDLQKDAITLLGQVREHVTLLAQHAPDVAAAVTDWTLRGQMQASTMQRLMKHANAGQLFALPMHLGMETFGALLQIANEETLVRFIRDFSTSQDLASSQALVLLREDGPGHLQAYMRREGGGPRAARVRHALHHSYGGPLSPETDRALHWALSSTDIEDAALTRSTLEGFKSLHVMGLPGFLGLPAAKLIAAFGVTAPFLVLALFLGLPVAGAWYRLFRPRRRLRAAPSPARVITVESGPAARQLPPEATPPDRRSQAMLPSGEAKYHELRRSVTACP